MNVGDNTTSGNSCLNESVELFVATDSELQVTRSYALDLEVFAGVSSKFENLSGEVFENSS